MGEKELWGGEEGRKGWKVVWRLMRGGYLLEGEAKGELLKLWRSRRTGEKLEAAEAGSRSIGSYREDGIKTMAKE